METVGSNSTAFAFFDPLLKRDGIPISVRDRRFWDLNDNFAVDYLAARVIGLLRECNFGYLKVDYNETLGIAANLHRLMLPRQSQIWAVLKPQDSPQRLVYSLAATFLGRMCLPGDVDHLRDEQWQKVLDAQHLYRRAAPAIKHGKSHFEGEIGPSWRHPRGWQAIGRLSCMGPMTDGAQLWSCTLSPKRQHRW